MLYTTRWVASECRLEAKFEYVILFLVPDYRSRHVIYLKLYCSFPSNGHSFCPHRSTTTSSFLFLSLKPRLTFFHLFLPTSMPSLFWCGCCRAAEAVIVDTRQGIGEGGPRARRASTSSTSSLAYLDAVEAESELASLSLHFDRRSSTEDLFFDAEGGPAVAKEDEPTCGEKKPIIL